LNLTFRDVLVLLGGWTAVIAAVFAATNKIVTERILSKWRRDEQSLLEEIRHTLSNDRLLLEGAIRGSQQGQDASHQKRLAAIEHLWSTILKLRSEFGGVLFFFGILLPEEYDLVFKKGHERIAATIGNVNEDFLTAIMQAVGDIELDRPYLGEVLWLQFFIYRAFFGRLGYLVSKGKEQQHIENWRNDAGIRQLLSDVLPASSIEMLFGRKSDITALNRAFGQLESMILEEISLILSGRRSAFESFENAKELQRAVSKFVEDSRRNANSTIEH
jgi:hypothetical protein